MGLTMPEPDSARLQELFLDREARGLRVPLVARMVLLVLGLISVVAWDLSGGAATTPVALRMAVMGVVFVGIAMNVYLYRQLVRGRAVGWVGATGASFDALMTVVFVALALWSVMEVQASPAAVFSTELPLTYCALVVINGMTLRPRYPLIVGAGAILSLVGAVVWAFLSPRSNFSSIRSEIVAGQAYDPTQIIFSVVLVAGVVAATAFAARVARATIRDGIRVELELARFQETHLRLVMQEKVTALGRLVAGVSHELNNPLGVLRSGIDTQARLLEKMGAAVDDEAKLKKLLDVGRGSLPGFRIAVERISAFEGSLRALSHVDEGGRQAVDLHAELETIVDVARREAAVDTDIVIVQGPIPRVEIDPAAMGQALLTLVSWVLRASSADRPASIRTLVDARELCIVIEGGARPVTSQELASLFDVHFDGSGPRVRAETALAASRAAAVRHGGDVNAEAMDEAGVRFTVRLPLPTGGDDADGSSPA